MDNTATTLDVIRAGWPIVVALVMLTLAYARVDSMARGNKDAIKILRDEYMSDKKEILQEISNTEAKLEAKIDGMGSRTDIQLSKVHEQLERISTRNDLQNAKIQEGLMMANNVLSEMRGRLYARDGNSPTL